jgi:hypothetical protein
LFLRIHAGLELTATVELAVSPIILEMPAVGNVIGVGVVNKIFNFFALFLVFFGFVLIFDFGFDIEESGAVILPALAAMALRDVSVTDCKTGSGELQKSRPTTNGGDKRETEGGLTC